MLSIAEVYDVVKAYIAQAAQARCVAYRWWQEAVYLEQQVRACLLA